MLLRPHFTSQHLPLSIRAPMYLQYVIAALAACTVETYHNLALTFYHQARLCAEEEESKV
jgi:hypothetical protein